MSKGNKELDPTKNVFASERARTELRPIAGARFKAMSTAVGTVFMKGNAALAAMDKFNRHMPTPEQATGFIATSTVTQAPAAVIPHALSPDAEANLFDADELRSLGHDVRFDPNSNIIDHAAEQEATARQATEAAYQQQAQPAPIERSPFHDRVEADMGDAKLNPNVLFMEDMHNELATAPEARNPLLDQARQAAAEAYGTQDEYTRAA